MSIINFCPVPSKHSISRLFATHVSNKVQHRSLVPALEPGDSIFIFHEDLVSLKLMILIYLVQTPGIAANHHNVHCHTSWLGTPKFIRCPLEPSRWVEFLTWGGRFWHYHPENRNIYLHALHQCVRTGMLHNYIIIYRCFFVHTWTAGLVRKYFSTRPIAHCPLPPPPQKTKHSQKPKTIAFSHSRSSLMCFHYLHTNKAIPFPQHNAGTVRDLPCSQSPISASSLHYLKHQPIECSHQWMWTPLTTIS